MIDFGEVNGQYFIALEFIDGFDALALLRAAAVKQMRLPTPIAMFVGMEVLDALDYAHNAVDDEGRPMRLVHRDISPSNVFISRRGDVKLGDFGIAHAQKRESKTQAGTLKGKYGYMSPEQVMGNSLDARSDVFAVGIVVAEMLMGRRLFTAPNDLDVLLMVRDGRLERLDKHAKDLPPDLDHIVRKALAKRVEERFQSAAELREALGDLLFRWGKRVTPSDLGRLSADLLDTSPEAAPRLAEQLRRWKLDSALSGGVTPAPVVMTPAPVMMPPPAQQPSPPPEDHLEVDMDLGPEDGPADSGGGLMMDLPMSTPGSAPGRRHPTTGGGRVGSSAGGGVASGGGTRPGVSGGGRINAGGRSEPDRTPGGGGHGGPERTPAGGRQQMDAHMAAIDNLMSMPLAVVDLDKYEAPPAGRGGAPGSGAFPLAPGQATGRAPESVAELGELTPLRLFTDLVVGGETGLLRLELPGQARDLYLVNGAPESIDGSASGERLGDYLASRALMKREDLDKVRAQLPRWGGKWPETIAGLGFMRAPEVRRLQAEQVRERTVAFFAHDQGRVSFFRGLRNPFESGSLGLDPGEIIGAGVLTLPVELLQKRFRQLLDLRPVAFNPPRVPPEVFHLGPTPRELWSMLEGQKSVRGWLQGYHGADERVTFLRTLYLLVEVGLAGMA